MTEAGNDSAPWQVLDKRTIYSSDWINLAQWSVRLPDGSVIPDHHVLDYPSEAVAIIPIDASGRVLLIDHYRFITDTRGWEVPSGRIDAGESVRQAALRELMEETGYSASDWQAMGSYFPSNGSSNQVFHVSVARNLIRRSEPLDANETLNVRFFALDEVRDLIVYNRIQDGLSLTALCWGLVAGVIG